MREDYKLQPEFWIQRHFDYLLNYAQSKVSGGICEDLVQETYLAALKTKDSFRFESLERTWLLGILRHKIIDHYRKRNTKNGLVKERALKESDFEDKFGFSWSSKFSDTSKADDFLEVKDLEKLISNGLEILTPSEQKIMKLKMNGLSTLEICTMLNIGESSCWVHLSRARKKLRKYLKINYWKAA